MKGAKASLNIKSNEDLESVAKLISRVLVLPEFWFKSDQSPPHDITAMCEALGFEMWLKRSSSSGFNFTIETSMRAGNVLDAEFADLSNWLADHLRLVGDLDCQVTSPEQNAGEQDSAHQSTTAP